MLPRLYVSFCVFSSFSSPSMSWWSDTYAAAEKNDRKTVSTAKIGVSLQCKNY